ncbi:DUF1566 domain-containing protein [Candidatus Parcubacteria bacterium]|nr:DUF1566 domain-containing protein [Candidatus Parcubacteria bacterium]
MNIFTKKVSFIALLICLVGFFFLPKIALADNTDELSLKELKKHLEITKEDTQKLLRSSIQIFTDKHFISETSVYSTPEERAVPVFLKAAAVENALNYFFIDIPIKVTWKITKNAVDMAKLIAAGDVGPVLEKFERESISRAVEYGMDWLMQEEIKVAAGAIEFNYYYQRKNAKAVFQYIIIRRPSDNKTEIRFYSPNPINPPKSNVNFYHELESNLPPFITKIQGATEKDRYGEYKWIGAPTIDIIFDQPVPDLGLRPLSWWERNLTEPIKSKIKEIKWTIENISQKFAKKDEPVENSSSNIFEDIGKGLKDAADSIGRAFDRIKRTIDKHNPFGASLVQTLPLSEKDDIYSKLITENKITSTKIEEIETKLLTILPESLKIKPPEETQETRPPFFIDASAENGRSLDEIVEKLDDISEEMDVLSQKIIEMGKREVQLAKIIKIPEEEKEESLEAEEIEEEGELKEEIVEEPAICRKKTGTSPIQNAILINEIAWMGTKDSSSNEWIELKNLTNKEINLNGWQLSDKDEQIQIIFTEKDIIPAEGFYLLERTDDDSVPGLAADLIYTGNLKNSEEALYLFDAECQIQDEAIADPNWEGGSSSEKRTMERSNNLNWQTYGNNFPKNKVMGTPKEKNSAGITSSSGGTTSNLQEASVPVENSEPQFCSQENLSTATNTPIVFNEIAWMGNLADWRNEWLELKNTSQEDVSLAGWQLLDKDEQIKIIFDNDSISAQGFYLLERNEEAVPNIQADKIYSGYLNNENESLRLFDQNCNLIDEIIVDTWPAGDNTEKRTMEKDSIGWHTYDGNSEVMGTPKQENSATTSEEEIIEEFLDNTPPIVNFDLSTAQSSLYFTLSWAATDIVGTDSPSGIDSFSILYTDSSGDSDIMEYMDETWKSWPINETLELTADKTQLSLKGKNEHNYLFKIKAKDKAGNQSEWKEATITIELPLAQTIVISEIQLADKEFIELYNPTNEDVDISSWYFSYFPSNRDWNEPNRNKEFPEVAVISANSYYLIGLNSYPQENGNPDSDWQVYGTKQLNDEFGSIAIFSCNPQEATSTESAKSCKIDALGWAETLVKEENSALAPQEGRSLSRIQNSVGNYIDTNNNLPDFEIKEMPFPTNSKGEISNIFSPEAIIDLAIINRNNNAVTLSWSASSDQDTPVENLSYSIHCSKQEIDENNWDNTLISTSTTVTIHDLYYNSTYYFAVKAFDGQNYSEISNIVSSEIPLLGGILPATGQTTSYDKYDDGFYTSGCRDDYTDNNDGTITDNCTGLMWGKDGTGVGGNNGTTTRWTNAIEFCNELDFAGYTDWRLPSYNELFSIVDYENTPTINSNYFLNQISDKYWTSSHWKDWIGDGYIYNVYAVDFNNAQTYRTDIRRDLSALYYLRPVRGPENNEILPSNNPYSSYKEGDDGYHQKGCVLGVEDNGDGTKTDLCTNLIWHETEFSTYSCTWEQAVDYVENLEFAGHTDWRLPTIKELLLSAGMTHRGISSNWHYWSSTAYFPDPSKHWYLDNYVSRKNANFGDKIRYLASHRPVKILAVRNAD